MLHLHKIFLFVALLKTCVSQITNEEANVSEFRKLMEVKLTMSELNNESSDFATKWLKDTPDELLNNWIQVNDGDLEKTSQKLLKSIEWRRINDIENLVNWKPTSGFSQEEHPFRLSGTTNEGRQVLYAPLGLWDTRKAINNGFREDIIRQFTFMVESTYQTVEKMLKDTNSTNSSGQTITIIDMNGFSLRQVTSIRVLSAIAAILGIYQTNYPLLAKQILIINAPPYFSVVFGIIKSVASAQILDTFKIYSSDKEEWKNVVYEAIVGSNIPPELL